MNKRTKKLSLSAESLRPLSSHRLPRVAGGTIGGTTDSPTCTITDATTPYPTHACGGSGGKLCY